MKKEYSNIKKRKINYIYLFLLFCIVCTKVNSKEIQLKEISRIANNSEAYAFKKPTAVRISPDKDLYIIDSNKVLKFDSKLNFKKNMIVNGQGPEEIQFMQGMNFDNDHIGIYDNMQRKMVLFNDQSKFIKDIKINLNESMRFFSFYKGNMLFFLLKPPTEQSKLEAILVDNFLVSVDSNGNLASKIHNFPLRYIIINSGGRISSIYWSIRSITSIENHRFFISEPNEYSVTQFDLEQGKILSQFKRAYKRVKVTEETKKYTPGASMGGKIGIGDQSFDLPAYDYLDDIQKIIRVDDKIWVVTSTVNSKNEIEVDLLDRNGKFEETVYLKCPESVSPYQAIFWLGEYKDRFLYTIEMNQEDEYIVKKNQIVKN